MTRVSVVTVCYNSVKTIEATLQSVAAQDHPEVEHLVIDGGSTDGTVALIERHSPRLAYWHSAPDGGIYDAMNQGWRRASGELVGFLNADDVLASPQSLSAVVATFDRTSVGAVYGDVEMLGASGRVLRSWRSGKFSRLKYHWGWMTPHPATYLRRELLERYGGFRADLDISADYELMLRLFYRHRVPIGYLPLCLVRMAAGGVSNGSLGAIARANWQVYRSWHLNDLVTTPTIMLSKPFSKLLQVRL